MYLKLLVSLKKVVLFVFLFPFLSCVFAQTDKELEFAYPDRELVKVISYNIWCGFEDGKDVNRMKKMAEWLKKKDPEVVALQELCSFDEDKLRAFARMYGHSYVAIQKEGGYPVGVTSKKPIRKVLSYKKSDMGHGFMHVQTYGMDMIVLHLTPFNCDNRLKEAVIVTDYIKEQKLENCLVMGDFNSHSPFDAEVLEQHTGLIQGWSVYGEKYKNNNNMRGRNLDYSVQAEFLSLPLEDPIRVFVPANERMTYPAFTFSESYKGRKRLEQFGERIDYIYSTIGLYDAIVDGHVWNSGETLYLSDHFPIGVDLLLKKEFVK